MTQNFTLSYQWSRGRAKRTMKLVLISLIVLVCVVIRINSERTRSVCKECEDYVRIKRAKYYSSPPLRFYNKPPMTYPVKGAFSFTPPPGYLTDDARLPNSKPKVSSIRHPNEGLGDEDINNIMRFLSKQDLDKILEFANKKDRESQLFKRPNYIADTGERHKNEIMYYGKPSEFESENRFPRDESSVTAERDFRPYSLEYNKNMNEAKETAQFRFHALGPSALFINQNQMSNSQVDSDRVMLNQRLTNFNTYAHQEVNDMRNGATSFSDSDVMQEEQLPKPSNLRDDDFEVSYTNNVPTVVKANSNSYQIESLGSLPLMNYNSKLESVDSYGVPHYTVTSPEKYGTSENNEKIRVEPAPPVSTAQEQSDAHLKATKIWTHRSKGTAYTLHDDGTLSLEKPSRPQRYYGHT